MKKKQTYVFGFQDCANVKLSVDRSVFTEEHAKATLMFFDWDYDKSNDPIDEVLKKYAIEIISIASRNKSEHGVKEEWKNIEGFAPIDDSMGIQLLEVEGIEWHDFYDTLDVSEC